MCKDPPARDVQIPLDWLFGDETNVTINNIKAHQKSFKVDKVTLSHKGYLIGKPILTKQNSKNWERFPIIPGNQDKGYKDKRSKQSYKKVKN